MTTEENDGLNSSKRSSSSRRERDDRDAKSKGRSQHHRSKASNPGAVASDDRRERRKRSGDDKGASDTVSSSSRRSSKRRDEKSSSRKESNGGRAVAPGARASTSDRTSRKASSGERAAVHGAQASSTSDRASRKVAGSHRSKTSNDKSANHSKSLSVDDRATKEVAPDEKEHVVEATAVDDQDDDVKKEENEAKVRKRVQEETNKQRQKMEAQALVERNRMEQENERLRQEMEALAVAEQNKKRRTRTTILVIVVLLLLAGGVGAFFALQGGTNDDTSSKDISSPIVNDTVDDDTVQVTEVPSNGPSSSPTESLVYGPPSQEDCERIFDGLPLVGEESMETLVVDVTFDVKLEGENDLSSLLPDLQQGIDSYLVLSLVGCPSNGAQRNLHEEEQGLGRAQLEAVRRLNNIRYVVARAEVTLNLEVGACQDESPSCFKVTASLNLKLRGKVSNVRVFVLVDEALPQDENAQPDLLLVAPFETVIARDIYSNDPTEPPSSCGGASALSVYVNDEGFPDVPALESGLYCGCAKDTVYDRDLDVYMISSVTQQGCIAYCKENGYSKLY
ncbi:MAG: hypothetical protein SGBAC_004419 [Bacillariaceae sp.]